MCRNGSAINGVDEEIREKSGNESPVDERTEAEKRFAKQTAEERMRQLREQAGTTYKQQVEVRDECKSFIYVYVYLTVTVEVQRAPRDGPRA